MTTNSDRFVFGAVALATLGIFVVPPPAAAQAPAQAIDADNHTEVTFTRDVAPILQRSCQSCHRVGSIAPMSLMTRGAVIPVPNAFVS